MALLEAGDGTENFVRAPRSALSAPLQTIESRLVVLLIVSMPCLRELTLKLASGRRLAAVVPRERGGRDSDLEV